MKKLLTATIIIAFVTAYSILGVVILDGQPSVAAAVEQPSHAIQLPL